jgi:hypothetical protein
MFTPTATEFDQALAIIPRASWRVAAVQPEAAFRLRVSFADGSSGMADLAKWLFSRQIDGTLFEPLRDESYFSQVFVELGAVTWPNGADLAPDAMYDAIRQDGCWKPRP